MSDTPKNVKPAIIVMFALFFMIAFVTNFAGSMGVIVTNQFGASKALSQLGTLANFIAYACMGIPAGIILKRKGYKFTALAAVTVGFVGVGVQWLSGVAASFFVYVIGAFIAGFSMCMLNIVVNPLLNTLGGGGNRGNQLIQMGGSCNSIGGTIAPILLGWLIGGEASKATVADASPAMLIAMGIFAVAAVIIAMTDIPEPHIENTAREKSRYSPLSFRHFTLGAVAIFFYVGIEVGIPNTANIYFSDMEGVGPAVTGTMIGAFYFCMLIGRLVGSAVGGKVSSKAMLCSTSILAIGLLIAFIILAGLDSMSSINIFGKSIPLPLLPISLCGLCMSVMWGAIFNLSAEGLGKYTAAASGIFMTLVCGGGIIPFVQNLLADSIGSVFSYYLLIGGLLYLAFYALWGSKNDNKDIPID